MTPEILMASEKQKAASRANGAKSRGPVTPEGKLRSRRSSLSQSPALPGPLSQNKVERAMLARTVVLDGESRPRFHALMTSLQEELKPETTIENLLIHKMAVAHWRLMRSWGMERSCASPGVSEFAPPESPDAPTRDALAFGKSGAHLNEYEMRVDRQFTRALNSLVKFRAARTQHVQQTNASEVEP
jgi:hypothetical protein